MNRKTRLLLKQAIKPEEAVEAMKSIAMFIEIAQALGTTLSFSFAPKEETPAKQKKGKRLHDETNSY